MRRPLHRANGTLKAMPAELLRLPIIGWSRLALRRILRCWLVLGLQAPTKSLYASWSNLLDDLIMLDAFIEVDECCHRPGLHHGIPKIAPSETLDCLH